MQYKGYIKENNYISRIKNSIEKLDKIKKFREYQKNHPWAKVKYLVVAYGIWWGIKIGAVAYGPKIINSIQNKETKEKGVLEEKIDSTQRNIEAEYIIKEEDLKIKEKIKYNQLEELIK